jgi:sulfite reductase alpha subunit-like flavoprotein
MISAGTGIAPFLGFLQHRETCQRTANAALGEAWLFFGCRHRSRDFLFESELNTHLATGSLSRLVTAFSRDQPGNKVYIQHKLREYSAHVFRILFEEDGFLYVCG